MNIGTALRLYLLADSTIAGIVGTRIYPLRLPQKAFAKTTDGPAIVLQRISEVRVQHLRGADALARPRWQVDCWARTYDAAASLGNLVRQRLNGFYGPWTDSESPETTVFVKILLTEQREFFEEEILGGLVRHSADYSVYHHTADGAI